jgi:Ion channel
MGCLPWGSPVRLRRTRSASKVLAVRLSVAVLAALLTLLILWDAFQTMVLSRRVVRRFTPTRAFYRLLWTPWRAVAIRLPEGNRRENLLTVFGPLSLLLLIGLWALGLIVSFALLHWGLGSQLQDSHGASGFGVDLYMSGTTFVTLGLGDVTPPTSVGRLLTVLESGMGFAFLALVIGYVPLISQAFSRREVSISMLDARAGSPPTAARLLCRHSDEGREDLLELLRNWERWSAELLESHISFPVLSYFRSQHDNQTWVAALTTILDVCALIVARIDEQPITMARLTFAMARHAVLDLCAVFRLEPAPPPSDRLPAAEDKRLESILSAAGLRLRSDEASVAKFMSLRSTYEPYVHALSNFLSMPLPPWVPPEAVQPGWHTIA